MCELRKKKSTGRRCIEKKDSGEKNRTEFDENTFQYLRRIKTNAYEYKETKHASGLGYISETAATQGWILDEI